MEIKNILSSTSCLEFINELDRLVFELLYSNNKGYTLLSSKAAVEEAQSVIEKYDYEALKIAKKVDFENTTSIINEKREALIEQIDKHYKSELLKWADGVWSDMIENCLLCASINKENKENLDKIYHRALCAISWIKDVKSLSDDEQAKIVENFNNQFVKTLSSDENEYFLQQPLKSDSLLFLELRALALEDSEQFKNLDLNIFFNRLNQADAAYFNRLKNEFNTYKRTSLKDELILINTALELLNIQNDEEKYNFIKQIDDDFILFLSTNKKLEEADKLALVKRRIELIKDKKHYRKILTSSLNE